jgi:hypothetical protein
MQIKVAMSIWRHDDFREAGFSRFSLGLLPKLGGTSSRFGAADFFCRDVYPALERDRFRLTRTLPPENS